MARQETDSGSALPPSSPPPAAAHGSLARSIVGDRMPDARTGLEPWNTGLGRLVERWNGFGRSTAASPPPQPCTPTPRPPPASGALVIAHEASSSALRPATSLPGVWVGRGSGTRPEAFWRSIVSQHAVGGESGAAAVWSIKTEKEILAEILSLPKETFYLSYQVCVRSAAFFFVTPDSRLLDGNSPFVLVEDWR